MERSEIKKISTPRIEITLRGEPYSGWYHEYEISDVTEGASIYSAVVLWKKREDHESHISTVPDADAKGEIPIFIVLNGSSIRVSQRQLCIVSEDRSNVRIFVEEIPAAAYASRARLQEHITTIAQRAEQVVEPDA